MGKTFADKVIYFNKNLQYNGALPEGFRVLNPYLDNKETLKVMTNFYKKYYEDNNPRHFIIGINPSRNGAGITGVPFTDTKHLAQDCGITMHSAYTHEVSAVFMYDMIKQYGGVNTFYANFYINSPFPLAIIQKNKKGKWVNANYYDKPELFNTVEHYMIQSLKKHIQLGVITDEVFILGKKNAKFLQKINNSEKLFGKITVLEHPRFIQQYQLKNQQIYIDKYLTAFHNL